MEERRREGEEERCLSSANLLSLHYPQHTLPTVSASLLQVIAAIGKLDFPEQWPSLLEILVGGQSQSQTS